MRGQSGAWLCVSFTVAQNAGAPGGEVRAEVLWGRGASPRAGLTAGAAMDPASPQHCEYSASDPPSTPASPGAFFPSFHAMSRLARHAEPRQRPCLAPSLSGDPIISTAQPGCSGNRLAEEESEPPRDGAHRAPGRQRFRSLLARDRSLLPALGSAECCYVLLRTPRCCLPTRCPACRSF